MYSKTFLGHHCLPSRKLIFLIWLSYVQGNAIVWYRACQLGVPTNTVTGGVSRIVTHICLQTPKLFLSACEVQSTFMWSTHCIAGYLWSKVLPGYVESKTTFSLWVSHSNWFCHRLHWAVVAPQHDLPRYTPIPSIHPKRRRVSLKTLGLWYWSCPSHNLVLVFVFNCTLVRFYPKFGLPDSYIWPFLSFKRCNYNN